MIYGIPAIITLIILAVLFREEATGATSEYLAMVCIGAIFWPATAVWMVYIWFEWRKD